MKGNHFNTAPQNPTHRGKPELRTTSDFKKLEKTGRSSKIPKKTPDDVTLKLKKTEQN